MAIFDRHAVSLGAHANGPITMPEAIQRASSFAGFLFHLLFFLGDVGDHDSRRSGKLLPDIPRRHGLHGDRHHCVETKRVAAVGLAR